MAGIEGIGGNKGIDWKAILDSVTDKKEVDATGKAPQQRENLVLSEEDKQLLLNLLTTPEIDAPKTEDNPSAKLESLINKLQDGKTFNFTEAQTKTFLDTLSTFLQKVNTDPNVKFDAPTVGATTNDKNTAPAKNTSKLLFDIYALMCLLAKCAQEQKNAHREVRQAETTALMTSIQNQADEQKSAALTGLIAGSIICGLQAVAAGYSTYKTISNVKAESQLSQDMGVKQAATQLNEAKTNLATKIAHFKEFATPNPLPAEGAQPNEQIEQQRATLNEKVTQAKLAVAEKNQQLKTVRTVMGQSDRFIELKKSEAYVKGFSDVSLALGNLGQTMVKGFVDIQQAKALGMAADQKKAESGLEETKELMTSFQDVVEQVTKLAQAILQAENDSMRSAIQA